MKTLHSLFTVILISSAIPTTAQDPRPISSVPTPPPLSVADLPDPYPWGARIGRSEFVPLQFSVDLDRLAPLGTSSGNGAEWFADFSKIIGPRVSEYQTAQSSTVTWRDDGRDREVLPPAHKLLLEAESYVDTSQWSFYPEVYPWTGPSTPIANLLFALQLGRSWVARGQNSADDALALEDYRRSIRLGRLLLQDDVIYIQNLIGIHLVRTGAEAIYLFARERGDGATAAFAALVLQDCAVLRLEGYRRFNEIAIFSDFVARLDTEDDGDRIELRLPDDRLDVLVRIATEDPNRSFRIEATTPLWITSHIGTARQRELAGKTLGGMVDDPDDLVATAAAELMVRTFDAKDIESHWQISKPAHSR